jgi:inner membrane protein
MIAAFRSSPLWRVLLLGMLVLLLQAPSGLIAQVSRERQQSRDEAVRETSSTWGGAQQVAGPFLVVPYRIFGVNDKGKRVETESGDVVMLADTLDVRSSATVETLHRGLFEVPVYRGQVVLKGRVRAPLRELGSRVPREALLWNEAQVVFHLSDVHAIDRVGPLRWSGKDYELQGGGGKLAGTGVHALVPDLVPGAPADFSLELSLRGSEALYFAPTARETSVTLQSNWPHPKFQGAWLPTQRQVGNDGFDASWSLTSVAGGLPAAWKKGELDDDSLGTARFGVGLLNPVDAYRMNERTLKYDLLFIGLTFVVVWLFEIVAGKKVHALQYLMLGGSLCLFYLLELSLAEHIGFGAAYALAAAAVTAQVSFYARSILQGWRPAFVLMACVATLYGLLYLLLGAEDYALLVGSAALFAMLSGVMFLTRKVQWSALGETLARQ